jgi:hypothetical protein
VAAAGAATGVIEVGAAGFLAACFFGAAGGFASAAAGGGGAAFGIPAAGPGRPGAVPGSGVMMLTGGVEAALGKSALVGRPVGIDGGSMATGPLAGGGGTFQAAA